jgi:RNA polymerase sigma factor (sigma-70 family)
MASSITELFDRKSLDFWTEEQGYNEFDIFEEYHSCKDNIIKLVSNDPDFTDYIAKLYEAVKGGSRITEIVRGGSRVCGKTNWKTHGKEMVGNYISKPTVKNLRDVNVKISILEDFCETRNSLKKEYRSNINKIKRIRNMLISRNQRLVYAVVRKYRKDIETEMDLLQDGSMGLVYSIDMFNHNEGLKFSTYATWWIRQYISKSLQKYDSLIRLPPTVMSTINKINTLMEEFDDEEVVAKEMGIDVSRVRHFRASARYSSSLNEKVGDDDSAEEKINLIKANEDQESNVESVNLATRALDGLDSRERKIVKLRFGIEAKREYTLEEVGDIIGVTRERARQIERKAIEKMKIMKIMKI